MKNTPPKVVNTASTQEHLEIADIRDNIVVLKNGGACAIVQTTAVNFGLLSETEQDSIIYAYAGFLNSLSFSIQILILSKKMDITSYLDLIKQQEQKQVNTALKNQIQKYEQFIASIIQENKVLDKVFYIIVPFSPLELGVKGGTSTIGVSKKKSKVNYSSAEMVEKAKTTLAPRTDNICRLLSRMGLKAQPLTTTELIKLFYEIYNPEEAIGQKMVTTQDYQTPMVQPVVAMKTPPLPTTPVQPQRTVAPHRVAQATSAQPQAPRLANQTNQPNVPPRVTRQPAAQQAPAVNASDVQAVLSRLSAEVNKMQGR